MSDATPDMVASWVRTRGPRCTYPLIVHQYRDSHVAEVIATMHAMETTEIVLCRPLSGATFIDRDARWRARLVLTVHPITGAVSDLETFRDHDAGVRAFTARVSALLTGARLVPGNPLLAELSCPSPYLHTERRETRWRVGGKSRRWKQ